MRRGLIQQINKYKYKNMFRQVQTGFNSFAYGFDVVVLSNLCQEKFILTHLDLLRFFSVCFTSSQITSLQLLRNSCFSPTLISQFFSTIWIFATFYVRFNTVLTITNLVIFKSQFECENVTFIHAGAERKFFNL